MTSPPATPPVTEWGPGIHPCIVVDQHVRMDPWQLLLRFRQLVPPREADWTIDHRDVDEWRQAARIAPPRVQDFVGKALVIHIRRKEFDGMPHWIVRPYPAGHGAAVPPDRPGERLEWRSGPVEGWPAHVVVEWQTIDGVSPDFAARLNSAMQVQEAAGATALERAAGVRFTERPPPPWQHLTGPQAEQAGARLQRTDRVTMPRHIKVTMPPKPPEPKPPEPKRVLDEDELTRERFRRLEL